jgi:hypothetical protein
LEAIDPRWRKASYSDNGGNCVEVGDDAGRVLVRDTKDRTGPMLRFTPRAWRRFAGAECDLGVMMRNDPVELLDGDPWCRARWLAERCGLDAAAIWEWGVVERVTSGLRCTRIDLQPLGRQMLMVADRLATM